MDLTPQLHRRLRIGGALLGLLIGATMSWTTWLTPLASLRGIPIDAASFGLRSDVVALITVCNLLAGSLGGYVIARMWDRPGLAVVAGALITAGLSVFTGYVRAMAARAGNPFADFIDLSLPIGLLFGGLMWFLFGLAGSAAIRLALAGAARLFDAGRAILAWGLLVAAGIGLGLAAGGARPQTTQAIVTARAVDAAIHQAAGRALDPADLPPGYHASKIALDALGQPGPRLDTPYTLSLVHDVIESRESTIDISFEDGPVIRCVATQARISRCFASSEP